MTLFSCRPIALLLKSEFVIPFSKFVQFKRLNILFDISEVRALHLLMIYNVFFDNEYCLHGKQGIKLASVSI